MTPNRVVWFGCLLSVLMALVVGSAMMIFFEVRRRNFEARVMSITGHDSRRESGVAGVLRFVRGIGEQVRRSGRLYPVEAQEGMEVLIAAAGLNPRRTLPILLGGKIALMVVLPVLTGIFSSLLVGSAIGRVALMAFALVVGMRGPDFVLSTLRRSYAAALERGTPDALDLLVVCSQAGMGLESAIERVSTEMMRSNRPTATALAGLLNDLRVLPDRRQAFQNFGRRSGVVGLRRLSTVLSQALQFGTPIGQALRAVAEELRREREAQLEERAVKLGTKLLFPMVLFMMPSMWIVLIGGTLLRLLDLLSAAGPSMPFSR